MSDIRKVLLVIIVVGLLAAAGCSGKMRTTQFTNPKFNFAYVERVAHEVGYARKSEMIYHFPEETGPNGSRL